jgi:hypothetical protein
LLTNRDHNVLRLWDLRKLRAGLKAIDLDWDAPPYLEEDKPLSPAGPRKPLEIQVVGASPLPR